jgi:hypothetical protein
MLVLQIIITAAIGLIAAWKKDKWKELKPWQRILTVLSTLSILLAVWIGFTDLSKNARIARVASRFGDLSDPAGAITPLLIVGNDGARFQLHGKPFDFQSVGPIFKHYVIEGELCVDVVVRERNGEAVATIDRNTWYVYSDKYEFNNDDNGFELVEKGDRKVYFQIQLKNGNTHVAGTLFNKNGYGYRFWNEDKRRLSAMYLITPETTDDYTFGHIPRLFRYPREKFVGEREY